ncbi:hypothetical protein [Kitasatospora sp. NPDC056181]|uniref:hypothetical protein n=1 Tax=Kitasatospora sp. NPDC056181 TaxID=3345737 RepID=UPI0035DBB64E
MPSTNDLALFITGAATVLGAVIALCGVFLTNSYRRQARLKISERRLAAYGALWELSKAAAPSRPQPMSRQEQHALYRRLTDWYYTDGNGLLLSADSREIYRVARSNLCCPHDDLVPPPPREMTESDPGYERWRGDLSRDQFSLLRSQMKADLAIFGRIYTDSLDDQKKAFLKGCRVSTWKAPWRLPLHRRVLPRNFRKAPQLPGNPCSGHGASPPAAPARKFRRLLARIGRRASATET